MIGEVCNSIHLKRGRGSSDLIFSLNSSAYKLSPIKKNSQIYIMHDVHIHR
jgi:hypothetical protein